MPIQPYEIGICSWSVQAKSVPELSRILERLGIDLVQIACGDPVHASWAEGDGMPEAARSDGFRMSGAMIGFPGEDYATPQRIKETGGFGNPATRRERLERLEWALQRTRALGLDYLMFHGGFLPEPGEPDRKPFLDTLGNAAAMAQRYGAEVGLETGQETAELLKQTLADLACPNVKVNFDPANMLLYDMGDPIRAVEILGPQIRSVHVKDAKRPTTPGEWGVEVALGEGQVNIRRFVQTLKQVGYQGPLIIEREAGSQEARIQDCAAGIQLLRNIVAG